MPSFVVSVSANAMDAERHRLVVDSESSSSDLATSAWKCVHGDDSSISTDSGIELAYAIDNVLIDTTKSADIIALQASAEMAMRCGGQFVSLRVRATHDPWISPAAAATPVTAVTASDERASDTERAMSTMTSALAEKRKNGAATTTPAMTASATTSTNEQPLPVAKAELIEGSRYSVNVDEACTAVSAAGEGGQGGGTEGEGEGEGEGEEEEEEMHDCLWWLPQSSTLAQACDWTTMLVILASVVSFCLETLPEYRLVPNVNGTLVERVGEEPTFFIVESCFIAYFTIEYVMRFSVALKRNEMPSWIWQPLNLVDVIAILPYYISLGLAAGGGGISVVRILRITRVSRLFKLSRGSEGLRDMLACLGGTVKELGLFFLITSVAMVLFASAMFYCEKDDQPADFDSIPASMWWAIITMTTVGYGDLSPITPLGKFVGALTATIGVILVAIPAGIFLSEFMRIHQEKKRVIQKDQFSREAALNYIDVLIDDLNNALDMYRAISHLHDNQIVKMMRAGKFAGKLSYSDGLISPMDKPEDFDAERARAMFAHSGPSMNEGTVPSPGIYMGNMMGIALAKS